MNYHYLDTPPYEQIGPDIAYLLLNITHPPETLVSYV